MSRTDSRVMVVIVVLVVMSHAPRRLHSGDDQS
jgi:hypothetical protein